MFPLKHPLKNSLIPSTPRLPNERQKKPQDIGNRTLTGVELSQRIFGLDSDDDVVAELIKKEAEEARRRSVTEGAMAYIDTSTVSRPKLVPNRRFLAATLRSTISQNNTTQESKQQTQKEHHKHSHHKGKKRKRNSSASSGSEKEEKSKKIVKKKD